MVDVIVIGARAGGASTAIMLARHGLRVLVVDKAAFPSDTLSTHQVQLPGIARLERWGLLGAIAAAGTPATRRVRFDPGPVVLEGCYPESKALTPCTARGERCSTRSWSRRLVRPALRFVNGSRSMRSSAPTAA